MRKAMLILCAAASGPILAAAAVCTVWLSPTSAMTAFYERTVVPEERLAAPLLAAGESVVPLLGSEIGNVSMPNRRYAIAFLGRGQYQQALPDLLRIATDESERDLVRSTSLEAVWHIDKAQGRRLATLYAPRNDHLGWRARQLLTGTTFFEPPPPRWKAALGWLLL